MSGDLSGLCLYITFFATCFWSECYWNDCPSWKRGVPHLMPVQQYPLFLRSRQRPDELCRRVPLRRSDQFHHLPMQGDNWSSLHGLLRLCKPCRLRNQELNFCRKWNSILLDREEGHVLPRGSIRSRRRLVQVGVSGSWWSVLSVYRQIWCELPGYLRQC